MSKKVNMEDIAKKLNISKNTVSMVFRNMPGISTKTRKQVLNTAKQLGYVYKKSQKVNGDDNNIMKNVLLILSSAIHRHSLEFFGLVQYGIQKQAKISNLNVLTYYHDENNPDSTLPSAISQGNISGIIVLGKFSRNALLSITELELPTIIIDRYYNDISANYILTDNQYGGYLATQYLIKCGHKEIAFSGDITQDYMSFNDRYQGYLKALIDYNIKFNRSYEQLSYGMTTEDQAGIIKKANIIQSLSHYPTAIFCCNDKEAINLYKSLSLVGLRIPEDISIIGFDNIESSSYIVPELTTIHVSKEWMGQKAIHKLIDIMQDPSVPPEKILLLTTLVKRQSVKNINI